MYLKEELCRKINDLYPNIGQSGFDITVEYDTEQKVWLVDSEKGNHELKQHLEIQDAELV